ncbi:MAG TPA: peroxiredoxin [Fimbriimonadaceae bacterium]|nr:peroxiredoxin [Fimbriimonadaceae bacterium]HRJ97568.1 peroxiredoxin [Fimbriimonadaceae bacterium]
MLEIGQPFPEFSLADQDGRTVTKADLLGARAVIYFYPKDDTSGCTQEACEFRDALGSFEGARVIGVSPDGAKSHRKFADKFGLSFTLLADTEQVLAQACGVWVEKSMYGRSYMGVERTTFLLDAEGTVTDVWRKVKPAGHAEAVRAALAG